MRREERGTRNEEEGTRNKEQPVVQTFRRKRCAGMGRLQPITDKCCQQKVKLDKSPLSTPGDVPSPKERAMRSESFRAPRHVSSNQLITKN